nr:DUF3656 domain-containing protein [Lachnospiraceae bacterium]
DVKKQLCKTGNTFFSFKEISFEMDQDLFLPNKELNELRRNALGQMEELLLAKYRRSFDGHEHFDKKVFKSKPSLKDTERFMHIDVRTIDQFLSLHGKSCWKRVYLAMDSLKDFNNSKGKLIIGNVKAKREELQALGIEFYLRFPAVTRQKTMKILDSYRNIIEGILPDGFCVANLECLSYVKEQYPALPIVSDAGMYLFNSETARFYEEHNLFEHVLPYELHNKEIRTLSESGSCASHSLVLPVYGYIPAMESAGCLLKTNHKCRSGAGDETVVLIDRQKDRRMVITHCDRCENTVYNSVPLSLHKETALICNMKLAGVVMKFSFETSEELNEIVTYYEKIYQNERAGKYSEESVSCPIDRFTKGHFMKGVE